MSTAIKIMSVEQCGAVGKCQSHPGGYESACTYSYTKPSTDRIATYAMQQLEAARAKDVATHEKNLPALENNRAVAAMVSELMAQIGMPMRWSERDRNSRARYPKSITRDAGYITDLTREVKTDDGFDAATRTYEDMKRRYERYVASAKQDAEKAQLARQREQEAAIEKRKADMELAGILLRYNLPIDSSWGDVLEALCGRDQRLDLAVAMQQTRGDWSEGCYRVTSALQRFTIRSDEDKSIAADVLGCTAEFEDGRVFRDTGWNYDRIFASVADQQLVADVKKALERREGS